MHSLILSAKKEMSLIECKYLDKISILKSTVIKSLLSDTAVSGRVCSAVCLSNIYIISCLYDFIHIWAGDISSSRGDWLANISSVFSLSGRAGDVLMMLRHLIICELSIIWVCRGAKQGYQVTTPDLGPGTNNKRATPV